jgi:hypothetical protein
VEVESHNCPLFAGIATKPRMLLPHGDSVTRNTVGTGLDVIAKSGWLIVGRLFSFTLCLLQGVLGYIQGVQRNSERLVLIMAFFVLVQLKY